MIKHFILTLIFAININLWATDYYVKPTGLNTNSGTSIANAWQTMDQIQSFAWSPGFVAGDRIFFEGGKTFSTTTGIYIQCDLTKGTSLNPIVFSSYGTSKAILKAKANHVFNIWAPASGSVGLGLKFTNLILEGDSVAKSGPKNANGIAVYNSSSSILDYLLIEDLEIRGFAGNGIGIGREAGKGRIKNVIVRRVVSHNNPGAIGVSPHTGTGIVVGGADGALIEHCIAYKNGINNDNPGGPIGIWFWDCINSTIQFCESHHNETTNGDGGGFDIDGGCQNCIIQYCYSHDNAGAGYLFAQFASASSYGPLKNNIVRYNISQNDARKGTFGAITFWGNSWTDKVDVNHVYNNTIFVGGTADNGTPSAVKFLGTNCSGVKIRNNIFIASNNYVLINSTEGAMDTTKVHFQNNDYWTMPGTTFKVNWGSTYNSLTSWQAGATGQEKLYNATNLGLNIDPLLNDAGNGGTLNNTNLLTTLNAYKLQTSSGLINKGLDLTKPPFNLSVGTQDYFGNIIPLAGAYDLGAHDTIPIPDVIAPTIPSNLSASAVTSTGFIISWIASTDNIGVASYEIYNNGVLISKVNSPTTSFTLTGLIPSTVNTVVIKAKDSAGNVAESEPLLITTSDLLFSDVIAPTIPSNLSASAVTSTGFIISWIASTDNIGVASYEIYNNGILISKVNSPTTSFTLTGLIPSTVNSVVIKAKDSAGNVAESEPLLITTSDLLSTSENYSNNIFIYPNPIVNNSFEVRLSNFKNKNFKMSIYNNEGRLIFSSKIKGEYTSVILPEYIERGIYLVKFDDDEYSITKKIVVE